MIQSMTAFARQHSQGDWGSVTWEVRSVNHRYLDLSFRLPEGFRECEAACREQIRHLIQRGKLDISLRYVPGTSIENEVMVNEPLVRSLTLAGSKINALTANQDQLGTMELLRWPGVIDIRPADLSQVFENALEAFRLCLQQLQDVRQREGQSIVTMLEQRLATMAELTAKIKQWYPEAELNYRQRIVDRFGELKQQIDPDRLEQEMVLFLQKSDIDEELDRLATHMNEVSRIIKKKGAVGRRLDFLMQELNREANTLSSKSNHVDITQAAVSLKVLIEQMREQVQNVE